MSAKQPQKPWQHLPEGHRFDQLNGTVEVTDQQVDSDAAQEDDRVVARNAANIAGGIAAGGLQ